MSRGARYRPSTQRPEPPRRKRGLSTTQIASRLILLMVVITLVGLAVTLTLRVFGRAVAPGEGVAGNPDLSGGESIALGLYLSFNTNKLQTPAGADPTPREFVVEPGQTASDVARNLVAAGLISDQTLFVRYVRFYGLDAQLEVGTYQLSTTQTLPQIAVALINAPPNEIVIRFTEGWRREQMAALIDQTPGMPFSGADFLVATGPNPTTGAAHLAQWGAPPGASLEGFLFPDTYSLTPDTTLNDFVALMLNTFDERVHPQLRNDTIARGLSLYDVVTLAAIVEREAVVPDERPAIASVYLNRLAVNMLLQADPTVQYAMGYQPETGEWWNLNLTQEDYTTVDSPYNTYIYEGIPPGPIASPGLASIQAVVYPADTDYYFFRAACDGSGRHSFAVTFEEHVANGC